jgi:hypothetical protein
VSSVTSRATTIHVAFSACRITGFIGETHGCAGVVVEEELVRVEFQYE